MPQTGLGDGPMPAVFPDWSPYPDLETAARAYLRDPDLALDALAGVLPGGGVLAFTLERFVSDANCVWQEVAVCDGARLVLWHGEDLPADEAPAGTMTSSVRVIPLSQVCEVETRRRLKRVPDGSVRVGGVDVHILLGSLDDTAHDPDERLGPPVHHDALRFVKTIEDGGPGQITRLEEFARTVSALIGRV